MEPPSSYPPSCDSCRGLGAIHHAGPCLTNSATRHCFLQRSRRYRTPIGVVGCKRSLCRSQTPCQTTRPYASLPFVTITCSTDRLNRQPYDRHHNTA